MTGANALSGMSAHARLLLHTNVGLMPYSYNFLFVWGQKIIHLVRILVGKDDKFLMIFWRFINELYGIFVASWCSLQLNNLGLRLILPKALHYESLILE